MKKSVVKNESSRRPRVVLADDHRLLREAFSRLLEPAYEIVGTVADGRELLEIVPETHPDIVVLDIAMPLLNGLDAARQLQSTTPEVKIIFLTVNEDPDLAVEAFRDGASGYLLKNSAASELLAAIDEVLQGRRYVTPLVARDLDNHLDNDPDDTKGKHELTSRQREVLQLLAEGYGMKKIASILKITKRTVAFHKYKMMQQLAIKSTAELIQYAVKHHLVST